MRWYLIHIFLFSSINLIAQGNHTVPTRDFTFYYANDITGFTDKYYTSGISFTLTLPIFNKSPFNPKWVNDSSSTEVYHTVNFIYDAFTPDLHDELFTGRPFSSLMMLGSKHEFVYNKRNLRITSELKLGMLGQATGAGKIQNGLHSIGTGADEVDGWQTQIRNDVAVNYIFSLEKQVLRSEFTEIIVGGAGYLGIPYTKAETMVLVRMGIMPNYFNRHNEGYRKKWTVYVFGQAKGAYNVYNATLQGGLFNSSNPYVLNDIEPLTLDLQYGLGVGYKNYILKVGQHLITPEFQGAKTYSWGEINFMVLF